MIWLGEEAKALLKQLEKLFKNLVVRITDFQNDWDRCDPIWRFCWQDRRGRWYETQISHYDGVYFIVNWGESGYRDSWIWEIKPGEFCREHDNGAHDHHPWPQVEQLEDMLVWLDFVEKDWMRVYRKIEKEWPNDRRNGYVPRAVVHRYVPKFPRQDKLAGEETVCKFCELVEGKYYSPVCEKKGRFYRKDMTAGDYLELVRIGLEATVDAERHADRPMTGEDYYKMNGYNRSSGSIFDVPRNSPEEFRKWIKQEEPYGWHDGGHQFWIGPGRIHLSVHLEKPHGQKEELYKVTLSAWFAWTAYNLARMAVAFYEHGMHVDLCDYENIRKALLAEDDLAIVERGGDTRYAGHNGAFESIWLSEIGSRYASLREFVRWKPLPILRPREHRYNPIVVERI
jgi:hypothetical protein